MTDQIVTRLRTLAVEVDAVQFDGSPERGGFIVGWVTAQGGRARYVGPGWEDTLRRDSEHDRGNGHVYSENAPAFVAIAVGDIWRRIDQDDWVVNTDEEFSPCTSDELAETYEVVSGPGPRTLKVQFVLEAVMCERCDTYFGLPLELDNQAFTCPRGHKNGPRKFEAEGA